MQDMAYVLATGYVSLCILLSGVFIRKSEYKVAPMDWLSYISYTRCVTPFAAPLAPHPNMWTPSKLWNWQVQYCTCIMTLTVQHNRMAAHLQLAMWLCCISSSAHTVNDRIGALN